MPPLSCQLKLEVQQLHAGMIRWCRAHFGEAFSAWMHVKLIKSYVESVMRYGLPVDFSAFMLSPKKGQDAKVRCLCVQAARLRHFENIDLAGPPSGETHAMGTRNCSCGE